MARNNNDYFQMLTGMVEHCCLAAAKLSDTFADFKPDEMEKTMEDMHGIEHAADIKKHEMLRKLAREFITPVEREDLIALAQAIDDVTDTIEDVVMRMYMFNVRALRPEAAEFARLIIGCCDALMAMMKEFHRFKKSRDVQKNIVEINRIEEEGDRLYMRAMHNLYVSSKDPIEILSWTQVFDILEGCCDACEDVSEALESVVMKNS